MKQEIKDIILMRIINAIAVAGITFFSTLSVTYPPTMANIYASLIAFALTFLVQLKALTNEILEIIDERKLIEIEKTKTEKSTEKEQTENNEVTKSKFMSLFL